MIDSIESILKLPQDCRIEKKIYKKLFYDNFNFTSSDKKLFKERVLEVIWHFTLKPENINALGFEDEERSYQEVPVVFVTLKAGAGVSRIAEIVHRSIPYPIVLFVLVGETFLVSLAHKYKNKINANEFITRKIVDSNSFLSLEEGGSLLEELSYKKMNLSSLFDLYNGLIDVLVEFLLRNAGTTPAKAKSISQEDKIQMLSDIEKMKSQIAGIREKISKEEVFSRKVEMNIEIKNIETLLNEKLKQVKE